MGPVEGRCFPIRILQLHPTRICNLRCLHCYSDSGPDVKQELSSSLILSALEGAREEGFTVAGFSGGEPTLYKPLGDCLRHAKALGWITTVTSNGMSLEGRRLENLQGATDLLAISLDGTPESHNRLRDSDQAFERMQANLRGVRESGIPFGFIFTLTQFNVNELEWVANFAANEGAALLQIHPLESMGRAQVLLEGETPDEIESAYAFLETARIQERYSETLFVQLDLSDRDVLRNEPQRGFAGSEPCTDKLADWVAPVVVEADGTVSPVRHGFPRAYAMGNLHKATFRDLAGHWKQEKYSSFRSHCESVFRRMTQPTALPFFNWYEEAARAGGDATLTA